MARERRNSVKFTPHSGNTCGTNDFFAMANDQLHLPNGWLDGCRGHVSLRLWGMKEHYMFLKQS